MDIKHYQESFEEDEENMPKTPGVKITTNSKSKSVFEPEPETEAENRQPEGESAPGLANEPAKESKVRKAAKIIIALGEEQAAGVLSHLDENTIEKIMTEVVQIRSLSQTERDRIMAEFQRDIRQVENVFEGGALSAKKLLRYAFPGDEAQKHLTRLENKLEALNFKELEKFRPDQVAGVLASEMPQTSAMIIAFSDPSFAAKILTEFDNAYRVNVAQKIASMKKVSPDIAGTVYKSVLQRLQAQSETGSETIEGEKRLSDILNHMNPRLEEKLLDSLAGDEPDLAERLRESMRTFLNLIQLTREELRIVMDAIPDERIWAKAMKGAGHDLIGFILSSVSANRASDLRYAMENTGPLPIAEIESARRDIMDTVDALETEGRLILRKDREEFID